MQRYDIGAIVAPSRRARTTGSRHCLPMAANLIERYVAATQATESDLPISRTFRPRRSDRGMMDDKIVGWAILGCYTFGRTHLVSPP
ncbi:hypothetical protein [Bradyrhizobium sp. USDA 4451]